MEVYKSADEKAEGFKKTLVDAEGKVVNDAAARLKAAGATVVADVKKTTSTVPEKVRDSVFTAGVTKNSLLKVAVGDAMYIVWVEDCSTGDIPTEADLQYVSFENDVYYKILNDLVTGAEKLIPADKTAAYTDKPAENSVEAWLFASIKNFTSAVEEGDTRVIETKKSESGEEITTYNVYLVLANPMHIDTELYVNGGYLSFTKEDSTAAQALAESLAGKTGEDLKTALSTKSTSAVTSESISPASVTDENLKAWLFSADRKANDYTVLDNAAGTSKYVAVYLGSEEAWKLSAISGATSARVTEHVAGFTANYTVRERALARVGQPTPETTTTTSAS